MPYEPPPELAGLSLSEIAALAQSRRLPPLEQWNPSHSGDSHMQITADGNWLHEGSPITRPAMVRAFASLLARDAGGQHWLVTPHERLAIAVDDAALIAIDMEVRHDPATGQAFGSQCCRAVTLACTRRTQAKRQAVAFDAAKKFSLCFGARCERLCRSGGSVGGFELR